MLPILLVATHADEALATCLGDTALFDVEVVTDVDELTTRFRDVDQRETPAAILVDLNLDLSVPIVPVVRALRRHFPAVPIVLACTDAASGRDLFQAVRAGAEHIAFLPQDDIARLLGRLISQSRGVLMIDVQSTPGVAGLPRPAQRVFEAIMRCPSVPDSVGMLAASLGISMRTFERRATRYGWPAPRQLLMWSRLVRGAAALDASSESPALSTFLDASGFPSLDRATRCCARLTGVALSTVLAQGMAALEPAILATFGAPVGREDTPPVSTRSTAA